MQTVGRLNGEESKCVHESEYGSSKETTTTTTTTREEQEEKKEKKKLVDEKKRGKKQRRFMVVSGALSLGSTYHGGRGFPPERR